MLGGGGRRDSLSGGGGRRDSLSGGGGRRDSLNGGGGRQDSLSGGGGLRLVDSFSLEDGRNEGDTNLSFFLIFALKSFFIFQVTGYSNI